MPEDLALQAFRTHYEAFEPYEEPHFRELYQAVGGNTLVLEVFARLLGKLNSDLEKHYTLEELVDDVEKGLLQPGQNAVVVEVRYQSLQEATPEKILGAMYKISDLDTKEAALLAVFAALPPERIAFDDLKMLLQQEALDALLLSLAQRGWLDFAREARAFRCSPVVQAAVRRQHGNWKADCGALVQGLAHGLDPEIIHEDNFQRSTLYARYAETVTAVLDTPDYDLATLCNNLGNFHTVTGDLVKALQAFVQMERLSAALMEGSPEIGYFKDLLAISYEKLGQTHADLGNLQQALTFFEEDLQLTKALYEAFPNNVSFKNGLAISYSKLGQTHADLGNLQQALTFFEEQTILFKALYEAFPNNVSFKNGLAISYSKLGMVNIALHSDNAAMTNFENCCLISHELYSSSPQQIYYCANYAESLAVQTAMKFLTGENTILSGIEEAIVLFEELLKKTGIEYYERKIALCSKMQKEGVDIRELIVEMVSF